MDPEESQVTRRKQLYSLFDRVYNRRPGDCGKLCRGCASATFPRGMRGSLDKNGVMVVLHNPGGGPNDFEMAYREDSTFRNYVDGRKLFRLISDRLKDPDASSNSTTSRRVRRLYHSLHELGIDAYLTNAIKCQSPDAKTFSTATGKPTAKKCVETFLKEEIRLLRPRLIVVLGRPTLRLIVHDSRVRKRLRKSKGSLPVETVAGKQIVLSYHHPTARNGSWDDNHILRLSRRIGAALEQLFTLADAGVPERLLIVTDGDHDHPNEFLEKAGEHRECRPGDLETRLEELQDRLDLLKARAVNEGKATYSTKQAKKKLGLK